MTKPGKICLSLLILIGLTQAAPKSQNRTQTTPTEDYDDVDDLLGEFLKGLKADLPSINNKTDPLTSPNLILISFDGFRWDYLDNHTLPNITKYFVREGVKVNGGLNNVFPTYTLPNLWTLATGLYPESHGLVSNEFYDPLMKTELRNVSDREENDVYNQKNISIPIWILNQLNQTSERKSANLGGYPGSNVKIMNMSVAYSEFHLDETRWFERIDRLVELFTMEQSERINLGVLYFLEPDLTGHNYGPYSDEIVKTLLRCDALVGYLIQRLNETNLLNNTNIILTSDHGMESTSDKKLIELHKYVNIQHITTYGHFSQVNLHAKNESDIDKIYDSLKNVPHLNVYKKNEIPKRFNYNDNDRIGDLILYADAGYEILQDQASRQKWNNQKGDHGYDNAISSMRPVFVARGPSFRVNHQLNTSVNLVDIYPLMCHLLELTPGPNNGSFERVKDLIRRENENEEVNSSQNSTQIDLTPMIEESASNRSSQVIHLVVNITQTTNKSRSNDEKRIRDFLDMFGIYHGHFKFVHLFPLIILIMILVTFFCLCKMELSRTQEMGFMYTPLDNNYICTRDIITKK